MLLNARSLKNKLCDFNILLSDDYSIISVTETWLDSSITNTMIDSLQEYNVHRNDRATKLRGDVLRLVAKYWPSFVISIPERFHSLDVVAVSITTDIGSLRYITVEFNQLGREYMVLLLEYLEYLCNTRDTIVFVGDFNLPFANWNELRSPDDSIHSSFLDFCIQYGLCQFVTSFTRHHHTLDLVFSSDPNIISDLCVQDTFSTSDHSMVEYNLIVRPHDCSSSVKSVIYD